MLNGLNYINFFKINNNRYKKLAETLIHSHKKECIRRSSVNTEKKKEKLDWTNEKEERQQKKSWANK